MKKLFLIAALFMIQTGLMAQDIKSDNLPDFKHISLSGKLNVTLEQSDRNSIEIKLNNSDLKNVDWSCKDNKLSIRLKATTQKSSSADVKIYYKDINSLEISGGTLHTEKPIETGIFDLNIGSGANVIAEINTSDLTMGADGNSATTLTGKALYLTLRANSKAKVDARGFESRCAIVSAQFGAEVYVWGTEKLDAKATSNGVIYYKGTPEILKISDKMMGSVAQFSL